MNWKFWRRRRRTPVAVDPTPPPTEAPALVASAISAVTQVASVASGATVKVRKTAVQTASHLPVPRVRREPMRVVYEAAVVHERTSWRARVVGRGARIALKPVLTAFPLNDRTIRFVRSLDRRAALAPRSRYVEPARFELGGVPVEQMIHRYGPETDMTILYLHGGGFFSCGIETHRRLCEKLALYSGAPVISVDYVQLPDGTVADSVQDAINAYEALVEMSPFPDKIVVAGDSAGGYLSFKIAELAVRRGLPAPAAIVTFSPLLSLDPERDDKAIARVSKVSDAYLPPHRIAGVRQKWMPPGATPIEGHVSILHAADHITSPTFFVGVEDEILRPEIEAMALMLADRGVEVETHLWRGQVHAFPVLADALPESRRAIKLAAAFARRAVGEPIADVEFAPEPETEVHEEVLVGEFVAGDPSEPIDEVLDAELDGAGNRKWHFSA